MAGCNELGEPAAVSDALRRADELGRTDPSTTAAWGLMRAGDESGLHSPCGGSVPPGTSAGCGPPGLLARDQVFEGVDRHRRAGIPVAGPIAAVLALLAVGQLPAIGAHLVQQLEHALPTIGEVLPYTLTGPAPQDRAYLTSADVAGDR